MGSNFRRYTKKASNLYSKYGFKGIYYAVINKVKVASLPPIYRNRFLRSMYHPKLTTAFLELTNNCNLRCEMCNWQAGRKKGYISKSLFESCVNQLSELGVDTLNLHGGGESLVHPNFKEFLKYAIDKRDRGKIGSVGWTTNGMLFNQTIADLAVSLNVDWVNFSLDGVGQVNDDIRLGSNYSIIEKNIKYLLEKRGLAKKPKVLLNMVDHGKTDEQKLEFYGEWVHLVDEIELIPSILPDNTWENKEILSKNLKIAPPPAFCSFPLETFSVSWDGIVKGCCFDTNYKIVLGDVTRESINQIWKGSRYQNFRKTVLTNNFSVGSPCYGCEFWQINFQPRHEAILNGKARIEYGYIYRRIRKSEIRASEKNNY
jgi:radical SAM protein with 4Fe4S-binding SPASM domain